MAPKPRHSRPSLPLPQSSIGSLFRLPVPVVPPTGVSPPQSPIPSSSSPPLAPHLENPAKRTWKLREDNWISNPPQVKSYLAYSTASKSELISEKDAFTAVSPNCGFGWRFRFNETFHYLKSDSNPRVQELVGRVSLTLDPNLCSSMPLSKIKVHVKVSYPSDNAKATQKGQYTDVSFQSETKIGKYTKPSGYDGQLHVEVTLVFSDSDGLSLPNTASISTRKALRYSLDGPSFVDTKFYLFSSRVQGRPARPKAVFANSLLLKNSSTYLCDLLSTASGFANGTPCDPYKDAGKEIAKLDVNAYDYDSDSDLEDEGGDDEGKDRNSMETPWKREKGSRSDERLEEPVVACAREGHAFAINGTAYKTWKAFLYYCYTNDVRFNTLRSRANLIFADPAEDPDMVRCSPKSMYRFADYANLPELMSLAKEAIRENLSQSNIVTELFSHFTFKYQEIIDMEIRYLVDNFTDRVANDFDEMLDKIVAGSMPHCGQVLKLTIKELRAANSKGPLVPTIAFLGKERKPPAPQIPTSIFQVPGSPIAASPPNTEQYLIFSELR